MIKLITNKQPYSSTMKKMVKCNEIRKKNLEKKTQLFNVRG